MASTGLVLPGCDRARRRRRRTSRCDPCPQGRKRLGRLRDRHADHSGERGRWTPEIHWPRSADRERRRSRAREAICAASPRLQTVHFGAADYAASTGMRTTNIGGSNADYTVLTDAGPDGKREPHWGDMWHYPLMRIVAAARLNGLVPIDGPFGNFSDEAGFRSQAMRTAVMGFEASGRSIPVRSRSRTRSTHRPRPKSKGPRAF